MDYEMLQEKIRDYKKIKIQIEVLKESINAIEITGIPAMRYDLVNVKGSYISDITFKQAIEYGEKKDNLKRIILILEEEIIIIDKARKILSDMENAVICEVLIEHKPYYRVCGQLNISEGYAKRIKKRAIKKMLDVMDQDDKWQQH